MQQVNFDILRNNLKTMRKLHDLTAKDLSVKAVLRQHKRISDIEDGRGAPSLDEIYSISLALEINICDLLFKELKMRVE
jgi:transcriptional regulator with XRE-family HTH domain